MKRLLFAIMLFASVQLRASHQASELRLRMFDNAWFTATIGPEAFLSPVTRLQIDHLMPGNHFVRIFRHDLSYHHRFGAPIEVFAGYVEIPAYSRVHAILDRQWRFRIQRITALTPPPVIWHQPVVEPFAWHMNDHEFGMLVNTISRLSFESSRMQITRQALASNYFSSSQVAELMRLMTFESTRLELAKLAWHKTVDQNRYYIVNDLFTFESSITELNHYIYKG